MEKQSIITTLAAHGFSAGDTIRIEMPPKPFWLRVLATLMFWRKRPRISVFVVTDHTEDTMTIVPQE